MQVQAIAKGMALGAAAGMIGYFVSSADSSEKSRLKRRTVKAAQAVGAMLGSVADILRG